MKDIQIYNVQCSGPIIGILGWRKLRGYEPDGSAYFGSPACRCGSRATKRVAGHLTRLCERCHQIYAYRLTRDGVGLVPFSPETAAALDEWRNG